MKKRSRIISYFLVILSITFIGLTGCNDDFFDADSGDRITPDQHYQSIIDADVSLQGAIVYLQDVMPRLILLDGLRSDMMDITGNADANMVDINNQVFTKGNPYIDPANLYKVIINVNEVLANIDSVASRDRVFNERTAHQYEGALVTLRAWTYFTLVRLYGKAAYFGDDNLTELPGNINDYLNGGANIKSKQEIISILITELQPYVLAAGVPAEYEELRIDNYMNTKALLGQLYLESGNYLQASNFLKYACESYGNGDALFKVNETYKDNAWETIFLNSESQGVENISVIPFSRAEGQFNPIAEWVGRESSYMVKPSSVVIDSFMAQISLAGDTADVYRGMGITFDLDSVTGESFITKYAIDPLDPFSSDIIITRAADLHLLLAEAYNRLGDEDSQNFALMFLNDGVNAVSPKPSEYTRWAANLGVRGRAYLQSRMVPERDSIPLEERIEIIEDNIIAERAMELAFEGKRWFDLVRVAERRNDPAYLADRVAAKFADDPAKYAEIHAKLMNPANWYLPLN
jgi:hypothetical protein